MGKDSLIKNCEFLFKCPQTWDSLSKTDSSTVRFCNVCDRGVYLAEDADTFSILASLGKCVAIREISTETDDAEFSGFLIGIPADPVARHVGPNTANKDKAVNNENLSDS